MSQPQQCSGNRCGGNLEKAFGITIQSRQGLQVFRYTNIERNGQCRIVAGGCSMARWTVKRRIIVATGTMLALRAFAFSPSAANPPAGYGHIGGQAWHHGGPCVEDPADCESGVGSWYWVRSPEQEARRVASLYNRYCVRCHGIDGRGVWDIPDVPDFSNGSWQACRSDAQLTRLTLEGRGAVMPAFRGTLTLEESAALARYLRRFAQPPESSNVEEVLFLPPRRLPSPQFDSDSMASPHEGFRMPTHP
jgi:hypothetical protein